MESITTEQIASSSWLLACAVGGRALLPKAYSLINASDAFSTTKTAAELSTCFAINLIYIMGIACVDSLSSKDVSIFAAMALINFSIAHAASKAYQAYNNSRYSHLTSK